MSRRPHKVEVDFNIKSKHSHAGIHARPRQELAASAPVKSWKRYSVTAQQLWTQTCQLLPIMSNKCWSGTGKEGKTKEVVKDREVKTVLWDKVVCLFVCMCVCMYVCIYWKVGQQICWLHACAMFFPQVEAAACAWWRRKGTWPHERSKQTIRNATGIVNI